MKTRGPTRRWDLDMERIFKNRCILCGRIIPDGSSICAECRRKQNKFLID
jgi:uncharacterized OB-fold protein